MGSVSFAFFPAAIAAPSLTVAPYSLRTTIEREGCTRNNVHCTTDDVPHGSKNDDLEQVLTRVSSDAHRVLEIARAAERKSMTELLRPVVEEYAARLAKEPEIAAMLEQARKYEARKKGVQLLPDTKGTSRRRASRGPSAKS